ncbi:hypothetical protein [uncultured Treponema sp.]|uniref:hypothetical protein n=1 Tax=uncultured Treponema sp. TaxID=162155 RepID=UPI0025DD05F1|nr:hypothetical protein [uncultured Treponema sp.]
MKKLIFSILPAFLFAFISCMNMSSGSGENGSVRVALPGSERATYTYSKNNADKFIVRLYNDDFDQTEEGTVGGVIEFGDLEPGKYTATAEAWNTDENILEGSGSTKITVSAGETSECNITMILEGQTAYYSQYMILTDYENNKHIYDYKTSQKSSKSISFETSYNTVEDNNGQIYHIKDSNLYKDNESVLQISNTSNLIKNPLYYDNTTNTYWIGLEKKILQWQFCLQNSDNSYNTEAFGNFSASQGESFLNFAVQENKLYLIYIEYNDSGYNDSDSNIIYFTKDENLKLTEQNRIQLPTIGVSGTITDLAVLEDGTVAVLVRSVGVESETEGFNNTSVTDGGTVYSRGALVLLSSDLSTYKVYGWTDSHRTISATGEDTKNAVKKWTSIEAYIPEYEERNSYFYGPLKIVAIRPKELVIADCGANFVLPDYDGKKNGKMYAHNRLMTVNLRNFAIGCKKEFSESELKFKDFVINGGIEATSASPYGGNYVDEK